MKVYKFIFYVPKDNLEQVKEAIFKVGAGKYGPYECCSWQTLGIGGFKALPGSEPYIGETGEKTEVEEYRVETICTEDVIDNVISALKISHPYEWPVYDAWPLTHNSSI